MHQEIVAVAFEIVADEFEIVAVRNEANALGEEWLIGLDLLQSNRSLLAGDLGDPRQLVNEVARRQPAHGESELGAERQAVKDSA